MMTLQEIQAWKKREGELISALKDRLEKDHGLSEHPKSGKLWALAWDYGHAYGANEIKSHYDDMAELLK